MPRAMREEARNAYLAGECRCLVSTTALAAGVNLPATHLIVRDLTFQGVGPIPLDQLIQMSGRAGRGITPGHAFFIHRPGDIWKSDELEEGLRSQRLPGLVSALLPRGISHGRRPSSERDTDPAQTAAEFVLSVLARSADAGMTRDELCRFASRSLAGPDLAPHLDPALGSLSALASVLAYRSDEGRFAATSLGLAAARGSLPLQMAAGIGQLVRDFLSLGSDDSTLSTWGELDHLLLLELLAERTWSLRPFSADLAEKVDAWIEKSADKSILYIQWIRGTKGHSKASELLGSLGLATAKKAEDADEWCRRRAYLAMFRAIVLWHRSGGDTPESLSRVWSIDDLSGMEEAWRDDRLWLLGALAEVFEIKCFYYHLRGECGADDERVRHVKRLLQRMRILALQTAARVKHCSALGPLLVQMRRGSRSAPGVGQKTIEKLEALGIQNLAQIAAMRPEDFKKAGITPSIAGRLQAYIRRRLN